MSPNATLLLRTIFLAVPFSTILGCASNIDKIPTTATTTPQSMSFNAPLDRVWQAAQSTLSTDSTFKILDRASSIMVTEFKTVESNELSLMGTAFLGKTYKSNYTVNFRPVGPDKTEVSVNVGLQAQQVGFYTREEDQPQVKSYMRKRLFDQITTKLGP